MPWKNLQTHVYEHASPFPLELGGTLPGFRLAYETWGDRSRAAERTIVILHALSGSSHAFASPDNRDPGWWQQIWSTDGPIHDEGRFIVCANLLGGCYGSTGPSSVDPRTARPFATKFPQITIGDMIETYRALLAHLGIQRPWILIGGSMGGMLALQWAIMYPDEPAHTVSLVAQGKSYAQTIAIRSVQRQAILNDPHWKGGEYYGGPLPQRGVELARQIGVITYRSSVEFETRFGRGERDSRPHFTEGYFEVESYLRHQGRKFHERFDANSYLYFSRAMDLYDVARGYGSFEKAFERVKARTLLLGVDTDILCPIPQIDDVHDALRASGRDVRMKVMRSIHGHDAFLLEGEQIREAVRDFLD